jgi:EAL domain-containing protein (putative c-di-GMP-specific phosphodiesterase class I)
VGCAIAQGYHFGRRLPVDRFDPVLAAGIAPERRVRPRPHAAV